MNEEEKLTDTQLAVQECREALCKEFDIEMKKPRREEVQNEVVQALISIELDLDKIFKRIKDHYNNKKKCSTHCDWPNCTLPGCIQKEIVNQ